MRQKIALWTFVTMFGTNMLFTSAHATEWQSDLEQARSLAHRQNKLLLIHFWTPECAPCKVVETKVFPAAEVAQAIDQHYVPLKVNAFENTVLRDFFNVRQWPTDVVATIDGQAVHQMVTPQDPQQYAALLNGLANSHRQRLPVSGGTATLDTIPSSPPSVQPQWASNIAPPDLSQNSAHAIPPGINRQDVAAFQPPLGGPMIPPRGDLQAIPPGSSAVSTFANSQQPSQPPRFGASQPPQPATVANHFVGNSSASPNNQTTNLLGQAEIRNPYAAAAAGQQPQLPTSAQPNVPVSQFPTGQVAQNTALQSGTAQPAVSPQVAVTPIHYGLDGRCPVTLVNQRKWVKGDAKWGAVHRGQTYLFAGPAEQQTFLADPDQFSPVLAGMDVVALAANGQVVQGRREFGVLYDDDGKGPRPNRIYLFDSTDTRDRFEATPESYVQPVMQAIRQNQLQTLVR